MNEKEQENLKIKNENCHVTNGPLSPVYSMVDNNGQNIDIDIEIEHSFHIH